MKKFLGLCVLAGLCFTSVLPVSAETSAQKDPEHTYTVQPSPRFEHLHIANFYFNIEDDGEAIVESDAWMYTEVDVKFKAQMFYMERGIWYIEKTWNDSAEGVGEYYFSETHNVDTDYNYKVNYTYEISGDGITDKLTKTRYF